MKRNSMAHNQRVLGSNPSGPTQCGQGFQRLKPFFILVIYGTFMAQSGNKASADYPSGFFWDTFFVYLYKK
jgi:hypothetical protein